MSKSVKTVGFGGSMTRKRRSSRHSTRSTQSSRSSRSSRSKSLRSGSTSSSTRSDYPKKGILRTGRVKRPASRRRRSVSFSRHVRAKEIPNRHREHERRTRKSRSKSTNRKLGTTVSLVSSGSSFILPLRGSSSDIFGGKRPSKRSKRAKRSRSSRSSSTQSSSSSRSSVSTARSRSSRSSSVRSGENRRMTPITETNSGVLVGLDQSGRLREMDTGKFVGFHRIKTTPPKRTRRRSLSKTI